MKEQTTMKFRNKKTGEIKAFHYLHPTIPEGSVLLGIWNDGEVESFTYKSLADFCEEWEDCNKPAEPLIKDEKTRKTVRAWAEVNDIDSTAKLKFDEDDLRLSTESSCIEFEVYQSFEKLEDGKSYTIDELCGEEE